MHLQYDAMARITIVSDYRYTALLIVVCGLARSALVDVTVEKISGKPHIILFFFSCLVNQQRWAHQADIHTKAIHGRLGFGL